MHPNEQDEETEETTVPKPPDPIKEKYMKMREEYFKRLEGEPIPSSSDSKGESRVADDEELTTPLLKMPEEGFIDVTGDGGVFLKKTREGDGELAAKGLKATGKEH